MTRKHITYRSFIAAIPIAAMFLFTHCQGNPNGTDGENSQDTILYPIMMAFNVQTLVSDSGRIKVRVTAEEYQAFKKDTISYWLFPHGLFVEQLNQETQTNDSEIFCKWAKYLDEKEFWELRDSVVAKNQKGEVFESDLLYWDAKKKKIYNNNEFTKITQGDNDVIYSFGIDAKDDFSEYALKDIIDSSRVEVDLEE